MPESWYPALISLFGAMTGSFLNVCIYRMPRGESIAWPGSRCGYCKLPIRWYDNIPVLSYVWLRAKCRFCKHKIAARYVLVEILTAAAWLYLWQRFGLTPFFWAGLVLISLLIAITFTDFETQLIPDRLTLSGILAGLTFSAVWPVLHGRGEWYEGLGASGIGLAVGGGILLVTGLLGNAVFKKESMGGGDIKLLAMLGAFLGWQKIIFIFFLSPFLALPFAFYVNAVKKSKQVPYGPFLALGGAVFYFFGNELINGFLHLYGLE